MALTKADKTWIESALAKALGQPKTPEPEPTWEGPDWEALTFAGDWSKQFDPRSGGRVPAGLLSVREGLLLIARGRVNIQERNRANQLLSHPLMNCWILASDTPAPEVPENPRAARNHYWNTSELTDLIIPGGGATYDRSRLNETDWRRLAPRSALDYVGRSGGADPVGSILGCFVFEGMTATEVAEVVDRFALLWMKQGEPPRSSWDQRFRPR